jgi:(p)ppGpp synthase/HD superfamily hydrolase
MIGKQYCNALAVVTTYCGQKVRKADGTSYVGHLIRVSGEVLNGGGDETEAVGGLFHDLLEDVENAEHIILAGFGPDMLKLVAECSDTQVRPKPPWRTRKEQHVAHVKDISDSAVRILIADKLDNIRSLLNIVTYSPELLKKFNSTPEEQLWYFNAMNTEFRNRYSNKPEFEKCIEQTNEISKIWSELKWRFEGLGFK